MNVLYTTAYENAKPPQFTLAEYNANLEKLCQQINVDVPFAINFISKKKEEGRTIF